MLKPQVWFFLLLVLFNVAFANELVTITNVQLQVNKQQPRIIFELTRPTPTRLKFLSNPNRLMIEFKQAKKDFMMQWAHVKSTLIKSISDQESTPEKVRITFFVNSPVTWKSKIYRNKRINNYRLQLDIVPEKSQRHSLLQQHFLNTLHRLTSIANHNILLQDELAQARKQGTLQAEKQKIRVTQNQKNKLFKIIIDPGHGGKDTGAIGQYGIAEKMVVLSIAKSLSQKLNKMPNMQAILTRDNDYFVPLRTRLALARQNNADLFIAIHADAYFQKHASGASVYALSNRGATSEAARWLAKKENYAELDNVEFNALKDRSLLLRSVLIDLAQTTTIRESLHLGVHILNALDDVTNLKNRRVEQAPFVVLKSPDIPSILIETGFITNPNEEKRLASAFYQDKLADAMAIGIQKFIKQYLVN